MGFFVVSILGIIIGVSAYILFRVYLEKKVSDNQKLYSLYNGFALVFGLIALATSWIWVYLFNLFTALPALLLGLLYVQRARAFAEPKSRFHKLNYMVLLLSIVASIAMLLVMQLR